MIKRNSYQVIRKFVRWTNHTTCWKRQSYGDTGAWQPGGENRQSTGVFPQRDHPFLGPVNGGYMLYIVTIHKGPQCKNHLGSKAWPPLPSFIFHFYRAGSDWKGSFGISIALYALIENTERNILDFRKLSKNSSGDICSVWAHPCICEKRHLFVYVDNIKDTFEIKKKSVDQGNLG